MSRETSPEARLTRAREIREEERASGRHWLDWSVVVTTGIGYGNGATERWIDYVPENAPERDKHKGVAVTLTMSIRELIDEITTPQPAQNKQSPKNSSGWITPGEFTPGSRRLKHESGPFYFAGFDIDGVSDAGLAAIHEKVAGWGVYAVEVSTFSDGVKPGNHRRLFVFFADPVSRDVYMRFVNAVDHFLGVWKTKDKEVSGYLDPAGSQPMQPIYLMPKEGAERFRFWVHNEGGEPTDAAAVAMSAPPKTRWRIRDASGRSGGRRGVGGGAPARDNDADVAEWLRLLPETRRYRLRSAVEAVGDKLDLPPAGGNGRYERTLLLLRVGSDWGIPITVWAAKLYQATADRANPLDREYIDSRGLWRAYAGCSSPYGSRAVAVVRRERPAGGSLRAQQRAAVRGDGGESSSGVTRPASNYYDEVDSAAVTAATATASLAALSGGDDDEGVTRPASNYYDEVDSTPVPPGAKLVPLTYGPDAHPLDRAAVWFRYLDGRQSGVVWAPMGCGKGRLVDLLKLALQARGRDLVVVAPTVALTHQSARDFELTHYSVDPTRPGATSLLSLDYIRGNPYIVVDEARECFGQLFDLARKQYKSKRLLRLLARAWNEGRLLLMGADLTDEVIQRFIAYAMAQNGGEAIEWGYVRDPYPLLRKTGFVASMREGRSALWDSWVEDDGTVKHFGFCTSQEECHTLATMMRRRGCRVAIFDRDSDRSVSIDDLFKTHDYVFATSAAASGMNIRTRGVITWVFDSYDGVDARLVIQGIGRVRNGTEVRYYTNAWAPRFPELDFEVQREALIRREFNSRRELQACVHRIAGDTEAEDRFEVEDPEYWDFFASLVIEDNEAIADRMQAIRDAMHRNGWDIDVIQPDPSDGDENPGDYSAAKEEARERQVEDIITADTSQATDAKNIAGKLTRDQSLANRKNRIQETHGVDLDPANPEHREIVWKDRDGKLTKIAERSVLAQMSVEDGADNLLLYDARVKSQPGGGIDAAVTRNRVRQARFFAHVWQELTGCLPGETATIPDDCGDRLLVLLDSETYASIFPKRRRPHTVAAAKRALVTLMRQYGSVSQQQVRVDGERVRRYTLTWQSALPGMNRETIQKRIEKQVDRIKDVEREQSRRELAMAIAGGKVRLKDAQKIARSDARV